jgi:hypothetical protein
MKSMFYLALGVCILVIGGHFLAAQNVEPCNVGDSDQLVKGFHENVWVALSELRQLQAEAPLNPDADFVSHIAPWIEDFAKRWQRHEKKLTRMLSRLPGPGAFAQAPFLSGDRDTLSGDDILVIHNPAFNRNANPGAALMGMHYAARHFRQNGKKVILLNESKRSFPFQGFSHRVADERDVNFRGSEITVVGGGFNDSLPRALSEIIDNHSLEMGTKPLTIYLPMYAIGDTHLTSLEDHYVVKGPDRFLEFFNQRMNRGGHVFIGDNSYSVAILIDGEVVQHRGAEIGQPGVKPIEIRLETTSKTRIVLPRITITSSHSGDSYSPGDTVYITFTTQGGIDRVVIFLNQYDVWWRDIIYSSPLLVINGQGWYNWTIPTNTYFYPSSAYSIEVRSASGEPLDWDISGYFNISN